MAQIFHRSTNTISRFTIFGSLVVVALGLWAALQLERSPYTTFAGVARPQPVPFSHAHHVGGLGLDCRYCHTSVENSSYAGIPPTKTCMNCHSQIWVGSEMLAPVRESYQSGQSLHWQRVYNLPGFVYFDHSIHIHKGVGCTTCHGQIDEMPLTYQKPSLLMEWCLDCHRNPQPNLREQRDIFNVRWHPPPDQAQAGRKLAEKYEIKDTRYLTSCTVCHR